MNTVKPLSTCRRLRSSILKGYYGNPAKDLATIIVVESEDSHASDLLVSILKTAGKKVKGTSAHSLGKLHKNLSSFWRAGADIAVFKTSPKAISKHIFHSLPIHTIILIEPEQDTLATLIQNTPDNILLWSDDSNYTYYKELAPEALSFGRTSDADLHITREQLFKDGSEAVLSLNTSAPLLAASILTSKKAPLEMAAATLSAKLLNIDNEDILDGLAFLEPAEK